MMGKALPLRSDLSADALRAQARQEKKGQVVARMLAIAHALDGVGRAQAARLAGLDRQALRDTVIRYNAEGGCITPISTPLWALFVGRAPSRSHRGSSPPAWPSARVLPGPCASPHSWGDFWWRHPGSGASIL